MKVYISADIEGCTGVVNWGQCGGPSRDCADWDFARRMMTHDINAAIRGAREAGAEYILVKDSHGGSKNLLVDELEPDVELISGLGSGLQGMMEGITDEFDCAMLVGYHAMAGTIAGVMEHTITGGVHRLWINGMPAGEIALSTATAGAHGVPVVMVASDHAGCEEAGALINGVKTASSKMGLGRYMARLKHPSTTSKEIAAAAKAGVEGVGSVSLWKPMEPVTIKIEQNRSEEIDAASQLTVFKRLDAYTLEGTFSSWAEAHNWTRRAMSVSVMQGTGAGK